MENELASTDELKQKFISIILPSVVDRPKHCAMAIETLEAIGKDPKLKGSFSITYLRKRIWVIRQGVCEGRDTDFIVAMTKFCKQILAVFNEKEKQDA